MPRGAIFDLDGLLIDSEPLWHDAEAQVLGSLGVPITEVGTRQTKGMVVEEVTRHWHERFAWSGPSPEEVAGDVVERVEQLVVTRGRLRPGAMEAVDACRRRGLRLALASSSHYRYIEVALGHFDLNGLFEVVRSAEEEPHGKPHPGVFLSTARQLGCAPPSCIVFEDAPAGVIAAKAARMRCVAVPDPEDRANPAIALADVVLESLRGVDEAMWQRLAVGMAGPP